MNAEAYGVAELANILQLCADSCEFYEPLFVLLLKIVIMVTKNGVLGFEFNDLSAERGCAVEGLIAFFAHVMPHSHRVFDGLLGAGALSHFAVLGWWTDVFAWR